jgi:hypothetical protein
MGKATYVLGSKIYRDTSRLLFCIESKYLPWQGSEEVQHGKFQEGRFSSC